MTDEQFAQLMKKLEDIERQMQAGTWMPRTTYLMQPSPYQQHQHDLRDYLPARWPLSGATD